MLLSGCLAASVAVGALIGSASGASAENRTLSMYFTHTKESITVTYKRNGRYDTAALKKINWFLRDWRRNEPTTMSRETLDLLWELHADLGSKKPIHIVSAYRSPRTNAMLKRIGRKVARKSQHMRGRAIDFYFPDVPVEKIMGSAFVRKVGGVGYYPRSGKYGFIHIDNGSVRHWPRMSATRQAKITRKYYRTVASRKGGVGNTLLAAANTRSRSGGAKKKQTGPVSLVPASMAEAVLAAVAATPAPTAKSAAPRQVALASIPKPRPKPIEVLYAAAAHVIPASAPAQQQNFNNSQSIVRGRLGPTTIASLAYEDQAAVASNISTKGSLTASAPAYQDTGIRPVIYANTNSLGDLFTNTDAMARRDGAPQPFVRDEDNVVRPLSTEDKSALARLIEAFMPSSEPETVEQQPQQKASNGVNRAGKADSQLVNRSAKGNFTPEILATQKIWKETRAQNVDVLRVVEAPIEFKN